MKARDYISEAESGSDYLDDSQRINLGIGQQLRRIADALEPVELMRAETDDDLAPFADDVGHVVEILGYAATFGVEQQARLLLSSNWLRDRGPAAAARIARLTSEAQR